MITRPRPVRAGRARWLAVVVAATGLVAAGLAAGPAATAAEHQVVSAAYTFVLPTTEIAPGDTLTYVNVDPVPHNVVATETKANGAPLFASDTIVGPATSAVEGVAELEPGGYQYICTIHPAMVGTLVVGESSGGGGLPLPPMPVLPVAAPAGAVATPTSITVHDGAMYAASYGQGAVLQLAIGPGGLLGPSVPYATGFTNPLGIAFAPDGTLFVSDSHPSAARPGRTAGRVWAIPPGGGDAAAVGAVVVDELPTGRHHTNGMAVHAERLYITNGNSTDDGVAGGPPEEPLNGTLLSVPVEARNVALADVRVEARGMRNSFDVAFRPGTDEAWMPMNGLDAQDPWGEDLLLKAPVSPSAPGSAPTDFGFPACVWRTGPAGPERQQNPAVADQATCDDRFTEPEATLGLHVSANGLAFGPGTGPWGRDLFIAEYGNNPGETVAGHKLVRVPLSAEGRVLGPPEDVVTLPGPLDVTFGPPGTGLYVADFAAGQILLLQG